nr:component of gems protein 1-like [Dermatophagoides farinae]
MAPIINPMMANIRPIIPIPIPIRPIIFTPISFHPIAATPPIAATFMNDPPAPPIPPVSVIDEATPFMNFVQRNFWSRMSNEPSSMFMRKWDKRPFMNDRSSNNIQRQPSDHDWYQDNNENNNNNNNNRDRNSRQEFRQRHWPSNSRSDHNFHQPINDDANDEVDGYDRAAAMAQMYDSFGPVWAESMNMNSMGLIPWHQFHHYHHHHDQHHHRKMFSSPADNPNGFQPTPILSPHPNMNFPLIANRFSPIPMPLFDDYDDSFTGDTMVGQASQINEHGINRNNNHNGSNNIIYVVNIDGRKGSKNNVKAIRLDDYLARNNNNNNNYNQRQRQPRFPWLNGKNQIDRSLSLLIVVIDNQQQQQQYRKPNCIIINH